MEVLRDTSENKLQRAGFQLSGIYMTGKATCTQEIKRYEAADTIVIERRGLQIIYDVSETMLNFLINNNICLKAERLFSALGEPLPTTHCCGILTLSFGPYKNM